MSAHLQQKKVSNVERRTWDMEAYEKKAIQRQHALDELEQGRPSKKSGLKKSSGHNTNKNDDGTATFFASTDNDDKEEFRPAASGTAGPEGSDRAFLKARSGRVVDIDSRVGRVEMVSAEAAATTKALSADESNIGKQGVVKTGIGWHCKVCDCFLKDSHTYLDHINGRKHQRKLGYSMRVERSTKEDLVAKLQALTSKKKDEENLAQQFDEEVDFNRIVQAKDEELQKRREERKKKRKEKKMMMKLGQSGDDTSIKTNDTKGPTKEETTAVKEEPDGDDKQVETGEENDHYNEGEEEAQIDPNLAAMMGFGGFGGSSKNG